MIYVHRDASLIPPKLLEKAQQAQAALEKLPEDQRPGFIKSKADIWRAFKKYLSMMSYGKCWYSESPDPQSFFDVDHYRPKLEARRTETHRDRGYEWLAFSWDNFRYSAQRSNQTSTNEDTDEVEGKGSWFPLLDGSPAGCWDDRCLPNEKPILLDPTVQTDVDLISVHIDGMMGPSSLCIGSAKQRVDRSITLYGLNLPPLTAARKRTMRDVFDRYTVLCGMLAAGGKSDSAADALPIHTQVAQIRQKTCPCSPYSRAARAQLAMLGCAELCARPEDVHGGCHLAACPRTCMGSDGASVAHDALAGAS